MKVPEKHRAIAHLAVDGAEIEWLNNRKRWKPKRHDYWYEHTQYRVKPPTPDYIDWSHVHEKFVALVTHKYDGAKLTTEVPTKQAAGYWRLNSSDGISIDAENFASFKKGNIDWKDSLVLRPTEAAKTLTKEQWAKIPVEFNFAAADATGEWYAYVTEPNKRKNCWVSKGHHYDLLELDDVGTLLEPDDVGTLQNVPWEDSLCKRPE